MIKMIGLQKVFLIAALFGFLVFLYFYNFMLMQPANKKMENMLSAKQSETSQLRDKMYELVSGLEQFEKQKNDFNNLEMLGFFDNQDRVKMRKYFNEMQRLSRLISARYTIGALQVEENEKAKAAGFRVIKTEIAFQLEAMQDQDIYQFIYFLNYGFPGHVVIEGLSLSRSIKITPTLLQKIGVGELEPIISGTLNVSLRTWVPDLDAQKKIDSTDVYTDEGAM